MRYSTGSATILASASSLFTLDESTFSRELAPFAGALPGHESRPALVVPRQRRRDAALPPVGHRDGRLANTDGFVDDTRAFLSIPARHDVARHVDCRYLAELVSDHRLELDDAHEIARQLTVDLPRRVFNLERERSVPRLADSTIGLVDADRPR